MWCTSHGRNAFLIERLTKCKRESPPARTPTLFRTSLVGCAVLLRQKSSPYVLYGRSRRRRSPCCVRKSRAAPYTLLSHIVYRSRRTVPGLPHVASRCAHGCPFGASRLTLRCKGRCARSAQGDLLRTFSGSDALSAAAFRNAASPASGADCPRCNCRAPVSPRGAFPWMSENAQPSSSFQGTPAATGPDRA